MEPTATQRLELFAENTQAIKSAFYWQNAQLRRLAALLYASRDRRADAEAIRRCRERIRGSAGLFSSFRGNSELTVATLLSLGEDPDSILADTLNVYESLKRAGFWAGDYLVIAAYQIASGAPRHRHEDVIRRTRAFYEGMRSDHFLLTGQNDYIFSAMLGLSDIDVPSGVERLERIFQAMRPQFWSGSGVQALSQVLVLGGDDTAAQTKVLALRDTLRRQGLKLDKEYTLPALGVLSLLPAPADALAAEVAQTTQALRERKGFSAWSVTSQELLLLSAGLVALGWVDQAQRGVLQTALATSIANLVIAQQTAIAAAAVASSTAASSSN